MDVTVTVNGTTYERDVEPRKLLIHFLRDDLDLTGSHIGCDTGNCGACSVIVNGVVRVALGCVDAVPVVHTPASADADAVRAAVQGADLDPPSDVHASSGYRRHLAEVLAVRAVQQASARS